MPWPNNAGCAMNGRFLLDTNAVVALLKGNSTLDQILQSANWVGISIITELEFLAFSGLSAQDEALFQQFKERVEIVELKMSDSDLLRRIIAIRQLGNHKMPDAIIAASALERMSSLLTQDVGFSKIPNLSVQRF